MKFYTLCICFPTFNRGDLFVNDIIELLSCKDERFYVSIQDNKSDDGSYEKLLAIEDDRLNIRRNAYNIGGVANTRAALIGITNAKYLLFCLDKDKIDINYLSTFIDFLEGEKPHSGYIDLYKSKGQNRFDKYKLGYSSIKHTAYLSKHPSGFFWEANYLERYIKSMGGNNVSEFPFWMDVIQAHYAADGDSYVLFLPLIIHAPFRKNYMAKRPKSLSYNEDNVYFSQRQRLLAYSIYMNDIMSLISEKRELKYLTYHIHLNLLSYVTVGLVEAYRDKGNCWHYNVKERVVSFKEIVCNIIEANRLLNELLKNHLSVISLKKVTTLATIRILSFYFKKVVSNL